MEGQAGSKAFGFPSQKHHSSPGTLRGLCWHTEGGDLVETSSPVPTERQPAHPTAEDSSPQSPFPQPSKLESACIPSGSRQERRFPCVVWKGFPAFPAHLRMRPVSRLGEVS